MNTPDPAAPAELADGKDTDPGEAAPSTPPAGASPDNASSVDSDAGPNAGDNASASPPAPESDLRAGIVFAPYRW